MIVDRDLRRLSEPLPQEDKLTLVSIADMKLQCRIDSDDEDELLAAYVEAAYDFLSGPEGWLGGVCLLNEDFEYYLPPVHGPGFELPLRPLYGNELGGLLTLGSDGTTYSDLDASYYYLESSSESFAVISRVSGLTWPAVSTHPRFVRVEFTAGFGDVGTDVPSPIRMGIRLLAAHWYRNREEVGGPGQVNQSILFGLKRLCGRYRIPHNHS